MTFVRRGFFKPGELSAPPPSLSVIRQPACAACGLYKHCISPKMDVQGSGNRKILIVGEAPGANEDQQGKPFVGRSGEHLHKALRRAGVGLFQDCWVANSLRCRPKANKLPKDPKKMIDSCRPLLLKALKELQPEIIILLGGVAVQSLIGWLWREDPGPVGRWVGWQIPSVRLNAWICPTYHPSSILRNMKKSGIDVMDSLFQSHLDAACALKGRPYQTPPDYERLVKRVMDDDKAADEIHHMIDAGHPVAFDLETTCLKPDSDNAHIVCCAVANWTKSVAFPWQGKAARAMKELLRSPIPKIGWNMKFEHRWISKVVGIQVRNWVLDGMLATHVLDSRRGTKSLKFQAFARLGADAYDADVSPYLKADTGNSPNRIMQLSLDKLLLYCGIDALLEYKLGEMLAPKVGVELAPSVG